MAIEKVVNITVNTNVDTATTDVNQLNKALATTTKEQQELKTSTKDTAKEIVNSSQATDALAKVTGKTKQEIEDITGILKAAGVQSKVAAVGQSLYAAAVGSSTGVMKAFRIALVTGIGAIVVGLGLLIANFGKVTDAVMKLVPGLKLVGDFVMSIVEAVTDFIGVTSDATRELDRLGEQADKTLAKNKLALDAYGDKYDEFTKRKIEANNTYAEHVKRINEDEVLSDEEKLAQLKLLRDRANRDIIQADKDREAKLAEERKKAQDKIDPENKRLADLEKERLARKKELDAANLKAANEFQIAINNAEFTQRELELENEQRQIDELNAIKDQASIDDETRRQQDIANEKAAAEAKKEAQMAYVNGLASIGSILTTLSGKNKAIAKAGLITTNAAALASLTINTITAVGKNTAELGAIPAIPVNIATIAGGIAGAASIVAATTKGLAALGGGSAGAVPNIGNTRFGGASTPPQFNVVGQSGTNQLAQSIAGQQNQPIEAYVVASKVSTAEQMRRNAIETASFP